MARFKKCPLCGASVKLENVERHIARAHPGERVDMRLTAEEREVLRAVRRKTRRLGRVEKVVYPLVAVVIVAVILFAVLYTPPHHSHETRQATDFTLMSSDGRQVSLSDYAGNVVLLDFMDTHCPHCQTETAQVLVPLYQAFGDRVVFLSIDVRFVGPPDTFEDIQAFKARYGATWTYLMDDGTVAQAYGVEGTPTTFVLRRDLTIQDRFTGETPYGTLATALEKALGG